MLQKHSFLPLLYSVHTARLLLIIGVANLTACSSFPKISSLTDPQPTSQKLAFAPLRKVNTWVLEDYQLSQQTPIHSSTKTPTPNYSADLNRDMALRFKAFDILAAYYQTVLQAEAENPVQLEVETQNLLQKMADFSNQNSANSSINLAPAALELSQMLAEMHPNYYPERVASALKQTSPLLSVPLLANMKKDCVVFYQTRYALNHAQQQQITATINRETASFAARAVLLSSSQQKQLVYPMVTTLNQRLAANEMNGLNPIKLKAHAGTAQDTLAVAHLGVQKQRILNLLDERDQQINQWVDYKKMLLNYRKLLNRLDALLKRSVQALQQNPPGDTTNSMQAFNEALSQTQQAYLSYQHKF
jgi:hypothetical protein